MTDNLREKIKEALVIPEWESLHKDANKNRLNRILDVVRGRFEEIRKLAKGISQRNYENGWIPMGDKVHWDLSRIYSLCNLDDEPEREKKEDEDKKIREDLRFLLLNLYAFTIPIEERVENFFEELVKYIKGRDVK